MKITGIDYVELYVGNVRQAAHFYRTALGFTPIAYMGPEMGVQDFIRIALAQHNIKLVLTSELRTNGPVANHIALHGDGIKDIALTVDDVRSTFEEVMKRGAEPVMEPTILEDIDGRVIKATIAVYGDTHHSFIQRDYRGVFLPGYAPIDNIPAAVPTGLGAIDHIAVSVEPGKLDYWIAFYERVLNFQQLQEENIATEYSAMNSKVVQSRTGCVRFPIMEPAPGKYKSQIEEYLQFYRGPGAQHIALLSSNILDTVRAMRKNGIEFLQPPVDYYEMLEDRLGKLEEDTATLREMNVLVDRDESGYLLQSFTKPLQSRPTIFLEVIQRKGACGFGRGNIKALFQSVEREQALRGNL